MLVIVAPGQGAQTPGFLTPWLEDPAFAARFEWLSTVAGLDLVEHGTTSDAETIRATEVAQPLLVATGLVAALQLFPHPGDAFDRIGAVAWARSRPPRVPGPSPPSRRWCWSASAGWPWRAPPR